jgi:hypothetical protein
MPNTTTLNETVRTLDGTEWVRLATPGANWRAQVSAILAWDQTQGQALTGVNDTNVTITLGGTPATALLNASSITLGWTGTLAVGRGGTGDSTLTANGVLYGNAASAVNVTAAAGANMVLWANSGAPSFTATPVIGTSTTCPLIIGGTAAGSTLTLESTSGAGTTDFVVIKTGSQFERMRADSSGNVNFGNQGAFITDNAGASPIFQISSSSDTISIRRYSADGSGTSIVAAKSRNATIGTNTAVSSGDGLFEIYAAGYDTTGTPVLRLSSAILFAVDAAPTAGSVAGNIQFLTAASGSASPTQRGKFDSTGQFSTTQFVLNHIDSSGSNISTFDFSNTLFSLATASNLTLPTRSGLIVVVEGVSGHAATYSIASASVTLVAANGTTFVAPTTTPGAGHASINWDGAANYRIYNAIGSTGSFRICFICG